MQLGVRELRDGLSRYLRDVHAGQSITVTDHGKPIARIVPAEAPTVIERLISEGRVSPGRRGPRQTLRPVETAGKVSDLVADQRR